MRAYFLHHRIVQIGELVYEFEEGVSGTVKKVWRASRKGLKKYPSVEVEANNPAEALAARQKFLYAYRSGNWAGIQLS